MESNKHWDLISPSKEEGKATAVAEEWVLLQKHPLFSSGGNNSYSRDVRVPSNLIAWDGASRLYFWDPNNCCLHRLSLRFGGPDSGSIFASSSSKILYPDIQIHFTIYNISMNRTGSSLLLTGPDGLCAMYLYGQTSTKDNNIVCRTISLGSPVYFDGGNFIRTLQASWHPYSDTHLGILSSDSVFRLFDLSSDLERPEQEYFLQPAEPGRCQNAVSMCAVAFSFGGEHLWDRFSVFVIFNDGSIYVLCPIVPFGSFYSWTSIEEIYKDAHTFGQKSSNLQAVTSSSFAIAWLEATFPDFVDQMEGGNLLALKAHPYVPFDASLALQGPLNKVSHHEDIENSKACSAECEGRAVSFLYNSISQDSVLLTAWSNGQLQVDALADELQPVWNVGSSPRIRVGSAHIIGVAMICESNIQESMKLNQKMRMCNTADSVWMGHPPPLLRLAVLDLALPSEAVNGGLISIYTDPLAPERIYCLHGSGIDLIVLHFLPFSNQTAGKDDAAKPPSVYSILTTCRSDACFPCPLPGFVMVADSFGHSWIVGVTSSQGCIVMEMKGWNMTLPLHVDGDIKSISHENSSETRTPDIISKELLVGPKVVLIPQASTPQRSLTADSIEGRATLHHYFKLFHENYVEYAHKVYVELKHHGSYLKRILTDQHERLREANQKLNNVKENQRSLDDSLHHAVLTYGVLEERLQRFRALPGINKRPLSRAEREFKLQLDKFTGMELDALHSSIDALNVRLRRYIQCSPGNVLNSPGHTTGRRKNHVPDVQISQLKSAIARLSLLNNENSKKVKFVESTLWKRESDP